MFILRGPFFEKHKKMSRTTYFLNAKWILNLPLKFLNRVF
jgi:hypothetical protein